MTIIRDEILEYPYTGFIERTIESAPTTPVLTSFPYRLQKMMTVTTSYHAKVIELH